MKLKKLFRDLLHLLIHNSFPATVLVMGVVHFALLLITLAAGAVPLTIINSISVITYIVCFLFCRVDYILPVYWLILIEVTVYAVLSTYYIGYGGVSHFFLFSIVPIIIYFGLFLFKKRKTVDRRFLSFRGFSGICSFFYFLLQKNPGHKNLGQSLHDPDDLLRLRHVLFNGLLQRHLYIQEQKRGT